MLTLITKKRPVFVCDPNRIDLFWILIKRERQEEKTPKWLFWKRSNPL